MLKIIASFSKLCRCLEQTFFCFLKDSEKKLPYFCTSEDLSLLLWVDDTQCFHQIFIVIFSWVNQISRSYNVEWNILSRLQDTHREKAPSNKSPALTKSTNMDIWERFSFSRKSVSKVKYWKRSKFLLIFI